MRPWREIAQELAQQTDREKIVELSTELNQALAEQGVGDPKKLPEQPKDPEA